MSGKGEAIEDISQLDWIILQQELHKDVSTESNSDRLSRKFKENPLVPIGCVATTMALVYGLWSFRKGDRKMSQYMMRSRIAAQGFTVVALIVGLGISASKSGGPV